MRIILGLRSGLKLQFKLYEQMNWEIYELPTLLPSLLWGLSFACLFHGVKKPPKHHGFKRSRSLGLVGIPGPFYCFFRGVRPSVGVKKWFEALTRKVLPFVVSFISHFNCSYNLNYNFRPLRSPSIILIFNLNFEKRPFLTSRGFSLLSYTRVQVRQPVWHKPFFTKRSLRHCEGLLIFLTFPIPRHGLRIVKPNL